MENLYLNIDLSIYLFTVLALLILAYLWKIKNSYNFFNKIGLENPPVKFFFGNFFETYQNGPSKLKEWTKKYGKTYGYFDGHLPILVTSDIEIVHEILVKQYTNFAARKLKALDVNDNAPRVGLLAATETRWKNQRNIINPAFSSLKLREMNPLLELTTDRFIRNLEKLPKNQDIDIRKPLKYFTMDTIWNCAFGIDKDLQQCDKEIIYINKTEEALDTMLNFNIIMYLGIFFHEIRGILISFYWIIQIFIFKLQHYPFVSYALNSLIWLRETSISIVNKRIENNEFKRDFLSLLVEAYTVNDNELQKNEILNVEKTLIKKKMSLDEIKMNLGLFIIAGYDTTSTTLANCFHSLALHQDEQKKLIDEVDEYFPHDGDTRPNSDNVKQLNYMHRFIDEVLRLNPIAINVVNRRCVHSTKIKGIEFPKGLTVQIDVESIHRDPELWGPVDTELFYPDRFSKEEKRHPSAFLGFGGGPRNCIGMKFAYNEMLIALSKVLRKYEINKGDDFNEKINFIDGLTRINTDPINIRFIERKF